MNIEVVFQLLSLGLVLITGPLVIILLASRNGNL
uniref:Photosystem II reaction center protein Psb30 n=1 Tax=Pedobesia claviformis TaxID=2364088 RepID=A0A386B0W6_9CHLO|nr:photosystem II protein psb30 [Pedobesia claviformis]AYC65341.1 photosystem II protein psb30 [Pedobesia claviformis]